MFALQMALNADLILPQPSWVSYAPQAKLLGRNVYWIESSPEKGYQWTLEDFSNTLQQTDTTRTKLLILNSPNNPTGLMFSAEFLQSLADLCRQHNIYVLSDELYDAITHGARKHLSLAQFYPEGTVVLGGLSKRLGLGGWRLGHAILPSRQTDWLKAALKIASEVWSCPAAPIQYAALTAYRNDPEIEAYIATCQTIHTARTQHVWS